ncbi:hypothetical protein AB1Y20_013787 [Prymnesium parvum]|uniref:FHA domain-containing protein n=1 Tax=Prymnesium parvum TaxID=97485 RepID=A0AB34IGZ5_PRYPA
MGLTTLTADHVTRLLRVPMAADPAATPSPSHATPRLTPQPPASFTPRPSASSRRKSSPRRSRSLTAPDLAAAASRCRPRLLRLHSLTPPATARLVDGRLLAALPPPRLRALRLTALSAEQIDALAVAIAAERRARLAAAAKLQRCLRGKASLPPPAASLPAAAAHTVVHATVAMEVGGAEGAEKVEGMQLKGHVRAAEGVGGGYPSHERLGRGATGEGEEEDGLLAALAGGQSFQPSPAVCPPTGAAASAAVHTAVVEEGGGAGGEEKVGLEATGEGEEEDGLLSALAGLMAFLPPPAASLPAAAEHTVVHTTVVEEGGGTEGRKQVEDVELDGHVLFLEGVGDGYPSHERLGRGATGEGEEEDGLLGWQSFQPSPAVCPPTGAAASTAVHTAVVEEGVGAEGEEKVGLEATGEGEEEDGLLSALAGGQSFQPSPAACPPNGAAASTAVHTAVVEEGGGAGGEEKVGLEATGEGEEEDGLLSALAGLMAFLPPPAASLPAAAEHTVVHTTVVEEGGGTEGRKQVEDVEVDGHVLFLEGVGDGYPSHERLGRGATGEVEEEDGLLSALAGLMAFLPPPASSLPAAAEHTVVHTTVVEEGGGTEGRKQVEDVELDGHALFLEGVGGGYPSHERLGRGATGEGEEEDGLLGWQSFQPSPAVCPPTGAAASTAVHTAVVEEGVGAEGEEKVGLEATGEGEEEDGLLSALAGGQSFQPSPAACPPNGAAASTAVHTAVVEEGGGAGGEEKVGLEATGEGEEEDGLLSALAGLMAFLPPPAASLPAAAEHTVVHTTVVEEGGGTEGRKQVEDVEVDGHALFLEGVGGGYPSHERLGRGATGEVEEEDGLLAALAEGQSFQPPPAASLPPGAVASTAVQAAVADGCGVAERRNVEGSPTGEGEEEDGLLSALAEVKAFLPTPASTGEGEEEAGLLSALAEVKAFLPTPASTGEGEEEAGLLSALAEVKAFLPTPASTGEGEEEAGLLSALAEVKAFLPTPASTGEGEEEDGLLSALAGVNAFLQPPAASLPPGAAAYTAEQTAIVNGRGDVEGEKVEGGAMGEGEEEYGLLSALAKAFQPSPAASLFGSAASTAVHTAVVQASGGAEGTNVEGGVTGEGEKEDGLLAALAGGQSFQPSPAVPLPPGAAASTTLHTAVVERCGDAERRNVEASPTGEGEEQDGLLSALAGVKAFQPSPAASLPPGAAAYTAVHTAVVEEGGGAGGEEKVGLEATGEGEEEDGLLSALAGVKAFQPSPAASLPPGAAAYTAVHTAVVEGYGDAMAENVGSCATREGEEEDGLLSALAGVKDFQLTVSATLPPAAAHTLVQAAVVENGVVEDGKTVEGGATGEGEEEDGLLAALAGVKAFPPPLAASLPSSAAADVSAFPSFAPPSTHLFPLLSSSSLESRASSLSMHSANRYSAASFAGGDGESSSGSPRRSRHSSVAGACELLIFVCSPSRSPLPGLQDEALRVSRAIQASIFIGGTAADLRRRLLCTPTRRFLFSGHADTGLGGARTLGFTSDHGELAAVHPPDLVDMLAAHAPCNGGELELVFLNGCHSDALGRAVHEAGIPFVVCWTTLAENSAAQLFATTFFETMAQGHSYQRSFQEAISEIKMQLRPGRLSNGQPARVPKYTLTDPEKPAGAPRDYLPAPFAAGIPTIYYPLNRPSSADCEHSPPSAAADDGECETQPFDGAEANCLHLPDGSVAARLPAEGGADILALGYETQPPRRAEPGREAPLVVETLLLRDAERKKKPWVSRLHAEVRRRGAELVLTAVGKSFSFVNEVPLHASSSKHPREVRLYHGDQLRFGGDLSESECGDYRKFIYFVNRPSLGKRPS